MMMIHELSNTFRRPYAYSGLLSPNLEFVLLYLMIELCWSLFYLKYSLTHHLVWCPPQADLADKSPQSSQPVLSRSADIPAAEPFFPQIFHAMLQLYYMDV